MRKVILSAAITLDGYIARPNGATDFIPMPKGASKSLAEFFSTIDTVMGGGEIARDFLRADLIDEISLIVVPLLLGEGIPLFPSGFPQLEFTLVESNTISGLLAFKYKRRRATPATGYS